MFGWVFGLTAHGVPRGGLATQHARCWATVAAVAAVGVGALLFDAATPQTVDVGIFYVCIVLIGFWFPRPRAAYALALLATLLILMGFWITIPDRTPARVVLLNRTLDIATVLMAAVFLSYTHLLQQKLKAQVGISEALSFEVNHRVGNHLQIIASLLALQAKRSTSEEVRQKLSAAGSQVMTIGRIQRMLSHSISRTIDSKMFIEGLVSEVRAALLDPDKIMVQADSASLKPTMATALGALLLESINNALKHAFPVGMSGTLAISFRVSNKEYTIELKDDGIGIDNVKDHSGFGTQTLTDITLLMRGVITHHAACHSETRPGTVWRLVIPA